MPDAVVLSGGGRYADLWHPFAETSAALAELVREAGLTVEIDDDPDAALAALGDDVRLVVVNAGDPGDAVPSAEGGARHPLVWAREVGRSRLVYDALGHDPRSYDVAAHRALIAGALRWLTAVDAP